MNKLKRNIILFATGLFSGLLTLLFGMTLFIVGFAALVAGAVFAKAHHFFILYNCFVVITAIFVCSYPFILHAFKNRDDLND